MKKILLVIFCANSLFVLRAQTSDAEAEAIVNLLGVQKKEAISKLVSVTGKDSVAFWKLYDEYQNGNKPLAKNRIRLYEQTARAYGTMNPSTADSLANKYFENRLVQEKNLEDYYKKIKSATNDQPHFPY